MPGPLRRSLSLFKRAPVSAAALALLISGCAAPASMQSDGDGPPGNGWYDERLQPPVYASTSPPIAAVASSADPPASAQVITARLSSRGCLTDLVVNGHSFSALLDSGAVGGAALVFGRNHARALGFDPNALRYRYEYSSANGDGWSADVVVHSVRLQSFVMYDVPVEITKADQDAPLLGAKLLSRFHFQVSDGGYCRLTLPD